MIFSNETKERARFRQWGRCACCGYSLDDQWEEAHHIYPHSLGGPDHVDNCVILCKTCHDFVHNDSNFKSCVVAPRDYFRYING